MESRTIDVTGLSCPEPVLQVQQVIQDSPEKLTVFVSSPGPRDNVKRILEKSGYSVEIAEQGQDYVIDAQK